MRRIHITGLLLLAGCGPELLEPAELGEVCGHESPFRVLELPPGEILGPRPQLLDDRLYYQVHPLNEPYSGSAHSQYSHVQSSGPCGERRRPLGRVARARPRPVIRDHGAGQLHAPAYA